MDALAAQAMIRFGLGRRGEEPPPSDPHGWLAAQVTGDDPSSLPANLPTTADALVVLREQRRLKPPPGQSLIEPIFRAEAQAQLDLLLTGLAPSASGWSGSGPTISPLAPARTARGR
jgi:hypothetical protein